jgi:hypothetical protein
MLRNGLFSNLTNASRMVNNSLPFNVPNLANNLSSFSNAASTISKASKFSFASILDNASRTVNTINQIIPLYQQVKPMISNAKTALNIFKNVNKIDNEPKINNNINLPKEEKQDINIKENRQKVAPNIIINKTNPNKPFFV